MFTFVVRCPVCKKQFDTLKSQTEELDGQGTAYVLNLSRAQHAKESPQCKEDDKWLGYR